MSQREVVKQKKHGNEWYKLWHKAKSRGNLAFSYLRIIESN